MPDKEIRVALWEYHDAEGLRHRAYFRDVVDLPEKEIERGEKAGVFGPPPTDSALDLDPPTGGSGEADDEGQAVTVEGENEGQAVTVSVEELSATADSATVAVPERPKQAATKELWVAYAVARGLTEGEAEAMNKTELITRLS